MGLVAGVVGSGVVETVVATSLVATSLVATSVDVAAVPGATVVSAAAVVVSDVGASLTDSPSPLQATATQAANAAAIERSRGGRVVVSIRRVCPLFGPDMRAGYRRRMRIGLFGGVINGGTIDDVVADAARAESAGFASYWVPNIFGHDALTTLAIVGREVPRLELGTAVVPTFPRHPMAIGQQCLTVSAACGGRLTLGIGLSHRVVIETMMGLSYDRPIRHIRDYLSILGPISRNEPFNHRGEAYSAQGAFDAAGAPPFGIVVAALGPQMLAATAELADGTLTWCTGERTLADYTVPTINAAAEAAGRAAPRVIAALPVCVTDDVDGARKRASEVFQIYGSLPSYRAMLDREGAGGAEDIAIIGTGDEVVDRIGALAEIGVTDFATVEFPGDADEAAATRAAVGQLIG